MSDIDFADSELVAKHGSWMRVQTEFYDFLFESAQPLCAAHFNEKSIQEIAAGFSTTGEIFNAAADAIVKLFPTQEDAWSAFVAKETA